MPDVKRLSAARALSFGEPLRTSGNPRYGSIVSETLPSDLDDRVGYGGKLIAESIESPEIRQRICDAVNFCGGLHFPPGTAYVGDARDMLEIIAELYAIAPDPDTRSYSLSKDPTSAAFWAARTILERYGFDTAKLRERAKSDIPF